MYIDTHTHLDFADFDSDRQEVIDKSREEGVGYIINVSSSLKGCLDSLELASRYDIVYAALGIHPHDVREIDNDTLSQLRVLLSSEKVVAIGEVGLDFYRNLSPQELQEKFFTDFINLSQTCGLPLIIHSRQAEAMTIKILKANSSGGLRGVLHCFSGDDGFLRQCLELGLYISFTCNITYKKANTLREICRVVPQDKLLLETDCPYLAPQVLRGKRNEPANVKYVAEALADIRGCSLEEIAQSTSENAKRLFGLGKIN